MTRTSTPPAGFTCGLDSSLRLLTGKWKPLIVYFLLLGPKRYGELKRAVRDASDKVLIQQLKELEGDGVVIRTDHKEIPPRVDYALSPMGESLARALEPLCQWGTEHAATVTEVVADRGRCPPLKQ
jgi:DNA-binding HxlR family transcriptional regulator